MKTVNAEIISEVFDMLKAGQWLKGVIMLGSLRFETRASHKDIMEHWADAFQGDALTVWSNRLIRAEQIFQRAEEGVRKNPKKIIGHYAKTIDIVQSSGMGKSRLVSEMAKKVMTISFVLRKPGQTGFPPGDMEVLDFVLAGNSISMQNTHMRAMCLLGGTFFEGQCSSISRSRCQADARTVAKWIKSKPTSGATLLEKWNDAMSPLGESLLPKKTDRRSDSRMDLYKSIIKKAEEYLKELVDGTIPGKVGSSGLEPGRKWNWRDREVVCLRTVKLTSFALLMLFSFRTTISRKSSYRSSKLLCLSCSSLYQHPSIDYLLFYSPSTRRLTCTRTVSTLGQVQGRNCRTRPSDGCCVVSVATPCGASSYQQMLESRRL
jgi:hypothetical protein